jgi:FkbM family methyltransferase
MNEEISKMFRSIQVYFPFLQDYRFKFERNIRKVLNKTHEPDFEIISRLPREENNLFLDIGANRGASVQSILMRRPDANVIAFEPNSLLTRKLNDLYADDTRVQIHNCGLGSELSVFDLYVPFYNDYMFDGLASFKEEEASHWLETRLYGYQSDKLCVKKIPCSVKRLDDFSLNPYFIKIDVQGFEYEVIMGGRETIKRSKPILLIETPDRKQVEFLSALGYSEFVCREGKLYPGTAGVNVYFIPERFMTGIEGLLG